MEVDNPYEVLGLTFEGEDIPIATIKKAHKKLALQYHPDKIKVQGGVQKQESEQKFHRIQKAYELLTDDGERAIVDERLRAQRERANRLSGQSAARRKLREDLERKEKEQAHAHAQKQAKVDAARSGLKQEMAAFQEILAKQRREKHASQAEAAAKGSRSSRLSSVDEAQEDTLGVAPEKLRRCLKVTWNRDGGEYDTQELRKIFGRFGQVLEVVVPAKQKKRKGKVLIELATEVAARQAADSVSGRPTNPLLVQRLKGDDVQHAAAAPEPRVSAHQAAPPPQPTSFATASTSTHVCAPSSAPHTAPSSAPAGGGIWASFRPSVGAASGPRPGGATPTSLFPGGDGRGGTAGGTTEPSLFPSVGRADREGQSSGAQPSPLFPGSLGGGAGPSSDSSVQPQLFPRAGDASPGPLFRGTNVQPGGGGAQGGIWAGFRPSMQGAGGLQQEQGQ